MKRRTFLGGVFSLASLPAFPSFSLEKIFSGPKANVDGAEQVILGEARIFKLPATPQIDQKIHFVVGGHWQSNPPVIQGNGNGIVGKHEDLILDTNASFTLVFKDNGWHFY
jgi:hypothetical protein